MPREPVPVKCVDCGAERVVSAADKGPKCYWCDGRMITRGNAGQVVTLLGYSENGEFYPAPSNPWIRKKGKRHKPEYLNQPRESVAIKPEIVLKARGDHEPSQKWRRS